MENALNNEFTIFVDAVEQYLVEKYSFARTGNPAYLKATKLVTIFRNFLTNLAAKHAWVLPDQVYAIKIVEFALLGIHDRTYSFLWENYYSRGESLTRTAKLYGYSTKNLGRIKKLMPFSIARQLQEKNAEISKLVEIDPMTAIQRKKFRLMETYGLTRREADLLYLLCVNYVPLYEKEIMKNLDMSHSGIRDHRRRIIRKMGLPKIASAVEKARILLESESD
jgi:DNA-binding CsgD family transcriptional regulator